MHLINKYTHIERWDLSYLVINNYIFIRGGLCIRVYMRVYIHECVYTYMCNIFCMELMYAHIAHICMETSKDYVYKKGRGGDRLHVYNSVSYRTCMCMYVQVYSTANVC